MGKLRTRIVAALAFVVWSNDAHPATILRPSVQLAWDPSADTNVIGYIVHYGRDPSASDGQIDVANVTNAIVSNLQPGTTYYFYATAYDAAHIESLPSNAVTYDGPVALNVSIQSDKQLHLTFTATASQTYDIQITTTFSNWTTIATMQLQTGTFYNFVDTNWLESNSRFYRLTLH